MRLIGSYCLAAALFLAAPAALTAAPIEVTTPDGRAAMLYDDFTWEYKRPPAKVEPDNVELDSLVTKPNQYKGQNLVVTGQMVRLLGADRLRSSDGQANIVVNVEKVRRADQITLEEALKQAGWTGSARVQIHGTVEQSGVTNEIFARDIIVDPN